jgi:murein hydrolase activator
VTLRALLLVPLLAVGALALAQTDSFDPAALAEAERRQLLAAQQQSNQAMARSTALDAHAASAASDAAALRKRIAALAARIQAAEADINAGEARVALVTRRLRAQETRFAEARGPLLTLTAALQQLSRQPPITVLAQPGSLTDMVHARAVLDSALPVIEARTAGVRTELASLRRLQGQARIALTALTTSRTTLAGRRTELSRLENERRIRARDLRGSARLEADRALGLGEQARDIAELMDRLESDGAVRDRLASLTGALPRPADPTRPRSLPADAPRAGSPSGQPDYRLPAVGRIVAGLGEVSSSGVRSRGLTIAARPGGQIIAPAEGRVVFAGDYRGYGKIVILDHGDGWTSLVTGMIGLSASVGDEVDAGSPLGRAGANRPRITVELRRAGQPVDIAALVG